ncbi:hypothetical protein HanIR_Chr14g0672621 [Helianthus annuus]|nr:hypothetical protein HanIR_Chr14g0672621 [Helianthus annuus]
MKIWDWKWQRAPNSDLERSEMEALMTVLQQQIITESEDLWVWKNDADKGFSVKGVRQLLARRLDINAPANDFIWNKMATK